MYNRILVKNDTLLLTLITFFPIIDISFAYFTNAEHMQTFYLVYMLILIIAYFVIYKRLHFSKKWILIIGILLMIAFFNINDTSVAVWNYLAFIIIIKISSEKALQNNCYHFIINNYKKYYFLILIYFLFIILSIFSGEGISTGWNTVSLKGPYSLNHTLAYELLVLLLTMLIILMGKKDRKSAKIAILFCMVLHGQVLWK